MEFKGTKSVLSMPCGATSGTNQDRPSNVVYSQGKVLAKFYGETPEEATANAKIFTCSLEMLKTLNALISDIQNLIQEHDIEWQQAGYFNHAKELVRNATTI